MKPIYTTRRIDKKTFTLAEHLDSYVVAQIAAAEYRCEGLYCRVEPVEDEKLYYIWTAPGRVRRPRTLSHEEISRGSTKFLRRYHE